MSNILYMAVSRDGFIANPNDETPWSDAEWEAFNQFVMSCDVVLLGKRTFEIMQRNDEFLEGVHYIVVTSSKSLDTGNFKKISIASRADIPKADRVGIIGGGELNGRLASLGLIDEMILDIEPTELHEGVRLFGAHEPKLKLQLLDSRPIGEATIQRHYKVFN